MSVLWEKNSPSYEFSNAKRIFVLISLNVFSIRNATDLTDSAERHDGTPLQSLSFATTQLDRLGCDSN